MALASAATVVAALQMYAPAPAAALPGLTQTSAPSPNNSSPAKAAKAACPREQHIVGGGAVVNDGDRKQVRLTSLLPSTPGGSEADSFTAKAEAPDLRTAFAWNLVAYAICADSGALPNHNIVRASVTSRQQFQTATARCPDGTVAYGSGADVVAAGNFTYPARGRIGLQLNRTTGPLDASRATGRTAGYSEDWKLTSYAICAQARHDIHAEGSLGTTSALSDYCDHVGYKAHGLGGGGGLTDSGAVWLQKIAPRAQLSGVDVSMTGPASNGISLVAHQTCAT